MRRRYTILFLSVFLLSIFLTLAQMDVVHAADSTDWSKLLLGDSLTDRTNKEDISYMEEMLAALVVAIPRWLIKIFSLEDISTLVLQVDNNWIHHTFPTAVWGSVSSFYNLVVSITAYLMVLGLIGWGIIFLGRAASSETQFTMKDMVRGFVIYIGGIWLASYLFDIIFTINDFLVFFAKTAMVKSGIPSNMEFLNIFAILDGKESTPSLGDAILYLIVVISVGILNYQYALRMLMLAILIIIFPICAYSSIFSISRRSLDMWFREFCSQVFMNAGHAIGFALFLILLKNGASRWILFAFLMGMPHITGVVRLIVGAPGGMVGGSMGLGSLAAITQMIRSPKGGSGGINVAHSASTPSNIASTALGIIAPKSNPFLSGMSKAIGKMSAVTPPPIKAMGKIAALTTASVGGAMIGGAVMGERGTVMGAAGGLALARKGIGGSGKNGSGVMTSSYDGENHRMNVRLPLNPTASHEQAWSMAQNKAPEGYNLKSVNLTPKGWMASMEKSNAPSTPATPRPTRRVAGMMFSPSKTTSGSPSDNTNRPYVETLNPSRKVGGMNLVRQPSTRVTNPGGQKGQTFPNQNASPRTKTPVTGHVVPPIGTTTVKNNQTSPMKGRNDTSVPSPHVTISHKVKQMGSRTIQSNAVPKETVSPLNRENSVPSVKIGTRAKEMGSGSVHQPIPLSPSVEHKPTIPTPTRTNQSPNRS